MNNKIKKIIVVLIVILIMLLSFILIVYLLNPNILDNLSDNDENNTENIQIYELVENINDYYYYLIDSKYSDKYDIDINNIHINYYDNNISINNIKYDGNINSSNMIAFYGDNIVIPCFNNNSFNIILLIFNIKNNTFSDISIIDNMYITDMDSISFSNVGISFSITNIIVDEVYKNDNYIDICNYKNSNSIGVKNIIYYYDNNTFSKYDVVSEIKYKTYIKENNLCK